MPGAAARIGGNLLGARLRDVPVLAELAVHVAARGGNREGVGSGQVVEERLLFDGIDVGRAHARVHQRVVDAAAILAHAAVAALLVAHYALARAELALDLAVGQLLVELRFEGELRVVLRLRARGQGSGPGRPANSPAPKAAPEASAHMRNERRSRGIPAMPSLEINSQFMMYLLEFRPPRYARDRNGRGVFAVSRGGDVARRALLGFERLQSHLRALALDHCQPVKSSATASWATSRPLHFQLCSGLNPGPPSYIAVVASQIVKRMRERISGSMFRSAT
jgi:hypothetical protein